MSVVFSVDLGSTCVAVAVISLFSFVKRELGNGQDNVTLATRSGKL